MIDDVVGMSFPQGVAIEKWTEYSFQTHFLTPSDSWSFSIGAGELKDQQKELLQVGALVTLDVNGHVQNTGYIDDIEITSDRGSGTVYKITGRDKMSHAVDAHIDPKFKFGEKDTVLEVLKRVYGPFGWPNDSDFIIDNADNVGIMTGQVHGNITARKNVPAPLQKRQDFGSNNADKGKRNLKDYKLHLLKPYPNEGAYMFVSRILQRKGLWHWPTADGTKIVVGKQTFSQEARYQLLSRRGNQLPANNVISSTVRVAGSEQPSLIIADGYSGGGAFGSSKLKRYMINPIAGFDKDGFPLPEVTAAIKKHFPNAEVANKAQIQFGTAADTARISSEQMKRITNPTFRALYLHDDESKDVDDLENFIRRQMSHHLKNFLSAHYTVSGHTSNGQPWTTDTIVDVQDDHGDLHEPMWILSRTFTKSRTAGTGTRLELILPGCLVF